VSRIDKALEREGVPYPQKHHSSSKYVNHAGSGSEYELSSSYSEEDEELEGILQTQLQQPHPGGTDTSGAVFKPQRSLKPQQQMGQMQSGSINYLPSGRGPKGGFCCTEPGILMMNCS
jgi:hypothetical protein